MRMISLSLSIPTPLIPKSLPARDRTIPFGKHKGRMLGTLPSKYLSWVSNNLRARDFLEWAELADEVLADPVYMDRVEWESAQRILTGDDLNASSSSSSPVSDLTEISGRFGWDNEDKDGWARVDFDLLGTSKGGRIPRINGTSRRRDGKVVDDCDDDDGKVEEEEEEKRSKLEVSVRGKREERRERRRVRAVKKEVDEGGGGSGRIRVVKKEVDGVGSGSGSGRVEWANPFPGRGALLDKIDRRV